MKEATGELNMTVITVVAIAAIGALFYTFVWPMIQVNIVQRTCDAFGTAADGTRYTAAEREDDLICGEKNKCWQCCAGTNCITAE